MKTSAHLISARELLPKTVDLRAPRSRASSPQGHQSCREAVYLHICNLCARLRIREAEQAWYLQGMHCSCTGHAVHESLL